MAKAVINWTEFTNEDVEMEHDLPGKWEICGRCEGGGTDGGASVECDGGGFTASEWAEQDEDFKEDYLNGVYDRPCHICKGTGKIVVLDEERCAPDLLKKYKAYLEEEYAYQAMCAAERRMGA
jgi:hypothetical protein